jgi:hypothetical protein
LTLRRATSLSRFAMLTKPLQLALAFCGVALASAALAAESGPVYELRTYTATPGNRAAVLARFRENTVRIFEQHGMKNIGYWVPADDKDGGSDKLIYLLEHQSREAAQASWKAFSADPKWKEVRAKSEANGKIVAKAESVFLAPTDYSEPMSSGAGTGAPRLFELRTYTAPEGKLGALDARFRDHTLALFKKHGITNLGYFHPTDADKGAANTLIYFIAHANKAAADRSWKAFREDPEWITVLNASQKDGKLTTKVDSQFLTPTDFSMLK